MPGIDTQEKRRNAESFRKHTQPLRPNPYTDKATIENLFSKVHGLSKETIKLYKKQVVRFAEHCNKFATQKPEAIDLKAFIESQTYSAAKLTYSAFNKYSGIAKRAGYYGIMKDKDRKYFLSEMLDKREKTTKGKTINQNAIGEKKKGYTQMSSQKRDERLKTNEYWDKNVNQYVFLKEWTTGKDRKEVKIYGGTIEALRQKEKDLYTALGGIVGQSTENKIDSAGDSMIIQAVVAEDYVLNCLVSLLVKKIGNDLTMDELARIAGTVALSSKFNDTEKKFAFGACKRAIPKENTELIKALGK